MGRCRKCRPYTYLGHVWFHRRFVETGSITRRRPGLGKTSVRSADRNYTQPSQPARAKAIRGRGAKTRRRGTMRLAVTGIPGPLSGPDTCRNHRAGCAMGLARGIGGALPLRRSKRGIALGMWRVALAKFHLQRAHGQVGRDTKEGTNDATASRSANLRSSCLVFAQSPWHRR
jgi:hypothetical protein